MAPMQRHVRNHPLRHEMLAHISLDQCPPIFRAQFTWKGDFDLAGQLGVLALLDRLDAVPQARAIEHPVRRAIGGHDLPMLDVRLARRSEEHTSELQSLMRISYAVFCLKNKINNYEQITLPL